MNIEKAAQETLSHAQHNTAKRSIDGTGIPHACWMLKGIVDGYVQGDKAQRWLGYAQGIFVQESVICLRTAKEINKRRY